MEPSDELDKKIDTFLESDLVKTPEDFTKTTVLKAQYQPISFKESKKKVFPQVLLVAGVVLVLGAVLYAIFIR